MNTQNDAGASPLERRVRPLRGIADRLRDACSGGPECKCTLNDAANEIERLSQFEAMAQHEADCAEAYKAQTKQLLAALKDMVDYVDERTGDNECRPLENARAAIAKATGAA